MRQLEKEGLMIRVLFVVLLSVGTTVCADDTGREVREEFLKRAKVMSVKDVGSGATKPLKVTLRRKGKEMVAIFKAVDVRMDSPSQFGGKTASEYSDSYKHELAAYELDKMLGLDFLPAIIERRIKGKKGSLREWVDDVMPRYGHEQMPPDADKTRDQIQTVWLFDYLIYNVDRRTHNLMIGSNWHPVLIDHSMAFTLFEDPVRPLYRFPKEVIEALRNLSDDEIKGRLKSFLRPVQIQAFMKRRMRVLDMVNHQIEKGNQDEVFFSLAEIR
jgi:hypothetical protein